MHIEWGHLSLEELYEKDIFIVFFTPENFLLSQWC